MITISDILHPEDVLLDLQARAGQAAIHEVAAVLKNDPRILDWDAFLAGLAKSAPCLPVTNLRFAICIPHTRMDTVTSIVMSVGVAREPIRFPGCDQPVRYLFCIGVQHALAADYLRIVGLLARIVKDPESEERLRTAPTGEAFVEVLARLEAKL